LLDTTIICVVGSRKCSSYGREQTEKITKGLCGHGITVVSGLAEGIDAVANHTALKYGKTIAVTAGGFDHIYPACNARLFKQIARDGLILSQRPPEIQAKPYMFPLRNKIMAAISRGVAVTEAGKKSGALITAANALELGRDVYVLPCNVDSHCGQGNNILLKLMQGALILGYEDILSNMGIPVESEKPKAEAAPADSEEAKMLGALERDSLSIDEISGQTGIAVNRVGAHLTIMEIKGLVKKLPGSRYKS
jgi:DNA processing protein